MRTAGAAALIAAMMGRTKKVKAEKVTRKCVLPECTTMTKHNGGYCCAEHCVEHRRRQRWTRGNMEGK